jgi:hypothetical protein
MMPHPVGAAVDSDDLGMVEQSVEHGSGQDIVSE